MSADSWLADAISGLEVLDAEELQRVRKRVTSIMDAANHKAPSGEYYCRALEPFLIEGDVYDLALERTEIVVGALLLAAEALRGDPKLRRKIGIPAYMDEMIQIDSVHGTLPVYGRFDGFVNARGQLSAFIEFNNSLAGGTTSHAALSQFGGEETRLALASVGARLRPMVNPLDRLRRTLLDDAKAHGLTANLRIGVPSNSLSMEPPWLPYLDSQGASVLKAPPEKFEYSGKKLTVCGEPLDYVVFEDLTPIFVNDEQMRPIRAAIEAGAVRTVEGIGISLLASYKSTFELLSNPDHRSLFSQETATVLEELIPWTRAIGDRSTTYQGEQIDLLSFVREHREKLVIKPCSGFRGQGVVLGWQADDDTWERSIAMAKRRPSIVQERAPSPPSRGLWMHTGDTIEKTDLSFDTNVFVWGMSTAEHLLIRGTSGDGIVNLSNNENGTEIPYLVVDPLQDQE